MQPNKNTLVGVAAHITAASKGGPRHDASLTTAQRRSAPNGIWCCCDCGKAIDDDIVTYTVEYLNERKVYAIARAHREVTRGIVENRGKPAAGLAVDQLRAAWLDELRRMKSFSFEAAREWRIARDMRGWETPFWATRRLELRKHFARCLWWTSTSSLYKCWRDARTSFPTLKGSLHPKLPVRVKLQRGWALLEDCRAVIAKLESAIESDAEMSTLTANERRDAILICSEGAKRASGSYHTFATSLGINPNSPAFRLAVAAWIASANAQPREQDAAAAQLLRSGWTPTN